MVKVYGIEADIFPQASFEEIITTVPVDGFVQFDTETTGFDPHTADILCFQLGNESVQYVIHPSKLSEFADFLCGHTIIAHNAKFDLKFLYKHHIFPRKIYDTMLAEAVIYCGIKEHRKNLAAVVKRRLGVDLDKSVRDSIWKEGLSKRVVEYAADDVKYLHAVMNDQGQQLDHLDLRTALALENKFVTALAYIEYCGFKLDKDQWARKMAREYQEYIEAERAVNQYIIDNNITPFISRQLDLFSDERKATINWASPQQVVQLFKYLKIPVSVIDGGDEKNSVASSNIGKYKKEFPFIDIYLNFKKKQKVVTTYGETFINQINQVTGRLHTNFTQIMDTSRVSSGGKNPNTKESYINFQNIPSDKETRSCFVADEGNTLVVCDYSGQEQIVLANFSLDPGLLEFYDQGLADMHSFVASLMRNTPFEEILAAKEKKDNGQPLNDIEKNYIAYRQEAKIAGFAINYGGNGSTIADQLGKTAEDGERVYQGYFKAFPGLKDYFENAKKQGLKDGYILINPITRRKSFISGFDTYRRLQDEMNFQFWQRWKDVRQLPEDNTERITMRDKIKKFFQIKGAVERKSLNFPIQGSSAEITKLACIYFFNWLLDNDLHAKGKDFKNKILIANIIHDEIVIECPLDMVELAPARLQECMVKAGKIYCKRVPLKADPEVTPVWKK